MGTDLYGGMRLEIRSGREKPDALDTPPISPSAYPAYPVYKAYRLLHRYRLHSPGVRGLAPASCAEAEPKRPGASGVSPECGKPRLMVLWRVSS